MTKINQDYTYYSTDINIPEPTEERTDRSKDSDRKKSSFLQTLSESFSNYSLFRNKGLIVNKKNGRKFSTSHQTIKYYKQRTAVYRFLQKPTSAFGRAYHVGISALILICIIMTVLSTFHEISVILNEVLYGFDVIIMTVLIIEYSVRFWASECVSHYRGIRGKIRFFFSPFRVIDMIVIITSLLIVIFSADNNNYMVPSLQWIRFFQTFKMIRFEHRFRPWRVMASVIWSQRQHLYITTYLSFLALLLTAFLIYFVEKDGNPEFNNLGQSLWWTVVTLCTIGYGDISPKTTAGKILASIAAIIGVSIFALPAGILGTGLALKVEEEQRHKKIGKRTVPAAKLIQSRWRLHRFYENPNANPIFAINPSSPKQNIRQKRTLTPSERNCLMFILKTKFFVSRHQFENALKPYDVKDVLEQYSSGHLEMLARIKHISHKVHTVESMAQSGLRGQHEAKSLITYRLVKLEEFMSETNSKLNQLLKIQNENRILYESILSIFETNYNLDLTLKGSESNA